MTSRPPRLAEYLLRLRLLPQDADDLLGDLAELFAKRARTAGRLRAHLDYWRETAALLWHARPDAGPAAAPWSGWRDDLRATLRFQRRCPAQSLIAVLTLAAALGMTTAVLSAARALLFDRLPTPDAGEVVRIDEIEKGELLRALSEPDIEDWRAARHVFSAVTAYSTAARALTGLDAAERVSMAMVDPEFFPFFRVRPIAGRLIVADDLAAVAPQVVVLSEPFWRSRFGGDPSAIGRAIALDHVSYRIVGVVPGTFRYPDHAVMWAALRVDPIFRERRFHLLTGLGRLARGVSLTQAQQAAGTMAAALARSDPAVHGARSVVITPLHAYLTRDVRTPLHFLLAAAVLVMLVACTNVSGILLTRTADRWRELGTRAAIGAGAGRLARLIAADAAVLTAAATGLGVLIAIAATATARQLAPTSVAARDRITVDFQILGWCVALAATAAMLTAVGPAARVVRMRVLDALGGSGRTATPRRFVRHALVAAQIAGAVALLVCGLLLTRSFTRLLQIDPGFKTDGGVIAPVRLPLAKYPERERYAPLLEELIDRTSASDGVSAAAVAFMMPLSSARLQVEVQLPKPASRPPVEVLLNTVSPSYFTAMRVPIARGRGFSADDTAKAPAVAIVSASLARMLWGRDDVTGEILQGADASDRWQIVGVAGDVKDSELTADSRPMLYRPFAQFPANSVTLIAQADRPADQLAAQLRTIITGLDRDIPVDGIAPLQSVVDAAVARARFVTALGGAFAIVAVVIAVIGLYAAIGYTVQTRTMEIGVRMALGATRLAVAGAVMRDVGAMLAAGLAGGVLAGLGGAQLIRQLLFEVSTFDLASVVTAVLAIAAAAALASAGALRAAISVDPSRALHAS